MDNSETHTTPQDWAELLESREDFPAIIHRWLKVMLRLIIHTHLQDDDLLGELIIAFMTSTHMDTDDLMSLSYRDSHHGAQYFLRALFERTVTLKYIAQHPEQAKTFIDFDALDWDQVLKGIQTLTGMSLSEPALSNLATRAKETRRKYKQEPCSQCGLRKQTSWTTLSTKDMAAKVGLAHLHLHSFLIPSKLMHPTLWGTDERVKRNSPMYNTLNCAHQLLVETILIHRRHFIRKQCVTPMMGSVIRDFLSMWVFAETSFNGVLTRGQERKGHQVYYG
jgi:Family of unknown function (DUF5677)